MWWETELSLFSFPAVYPVHYEQTFYQFFENTANLVSVVVNGSISVQEVDLTLSVDAIPRSASKTSLIIVDLAEFYL